MKKNRIIDVMEVRALRLTCTRAECGASVVVRPNDWADNVVRCPSCSQPWPPMGKLVDVVHAFALLHREPPTNAAYQLAFEIES
jgi:hypothetical protein